MLWFWSVQNETTHELTTGVRTVSLYFITFERSTLITADLEALIICRFYENNQKVEPLL